VCLSLLPGHHEVNSPYHMLLVEWHIAFLLAQKHSQVTMDWTIWNYERSQNSHP
jgi:hypothetical protein